MLFELEHLYICEQTGTLHICGDLCDKNHLIFNSDSEEICEISGLVITKQAFAYTKIERRNLSEQPEFFNRGFTKKRQKVLNFLEHTETLIENCSNLAFKITRTEVFKKVKLLKNTPLKVCYLRVAIVKLCLIFSKDRFKKDKETSLNFEDELQKSIRQHISTVCRNKKPKLFTSDFLLIANQIDEKKYSSPDMTRLDDNELKKLILNYAYKCVYFWYIIRTKTKVGKESPSNFPWWEFIESALLIFRDGLIFTTASTDQEIIVSQPDPFLKALPDKSPFLNEYNSGMKKTKRLSRTRIYNACKNALLEMVTPPENSNPEIFRFDNLIFDELNNDEFHKFRGSGRNKNNNTL